MNDDLIAVFEWQQPATQAISIKKALGYAIVNWPSGVRTLEQYAGVAVLYDAEPKTTELIAAKEALLMQAVRFYRDRMVQSGYLIRERFGHRRKARRIASAEFINPRQYRGPWPSRGGVISVKQ